MKGIKNFNGTVLSKEEMKNIKGGGQWMEICKSDDGLSLWILESQRPQFDQEHEITGRKWVCEKDYYID